MPKMDSVPVIPVLWEYWGQAKSLLRKCFRPKESLQVERCCCGPRNVSECLVIRKLVIQGREIGECLSSTICRNAASCSGVNGVSSVNASKFISLTR
jgi:hypothetical protein